MGIETGGARSAYITTPSATYAIPGGCWLDVADEGVVVIREGRGGQTLAAVAVSEGTWVSIGEAPPAPLAGRASVEEDAAGWPAEPPPDWDGAVEPELETMAALD